MDEKIPLSQGPEICGENRNAGPFHSPSTARFDMFLKEEAEYIITPIFFKERKKKECCEVRTREMLGGGWGGGPFWHRPTSDKAEGKHANAACGSMLVHVWTVITRRRGPYMRISMN